MTRRDEWCCRLATFQRALAKLRNEMNREIWKVSGRMLSHWLFSPLLLLSFSLLLSLSGSWPHLPPLLFSFKMFTKVFAAVFNHFYVWLAFTFLETIFHPLVPRWVSLCVCVSSLFPLTMYAIQCDIQLWCFFWSRLVPPGRLIGEITYLCSLFVPGVTHGDFKTPGRCYLL